MPESVSIKNLTIPVSMLTTILGGSAWLTSTRAELEHLREKVGIHRQDFKETKKELKQKIDLISTMERSQDGRLTRIESKQDLILQLIKKLEKRDDK
jgi:uncharacterized protein YdgA (DUF945 family)